MTDLGPQLDPTHLAVARWPRGWRPATLPDGFFGMVEDEGEVTLVCAEAVVPPGSLALEPGWRRITFAGPLPWEQVGFLADVAGRLASAQIPFTSMAGFTTDHVLVRAAQADLAVAVLRGEPAPEPRPGTTNP
ncbi:MAG: amino acid-binding protein [Frankiales bacterium]|nr:amino acid-binding protein [Frankiales bacterium]